MLKKDDLTIDGNYVEIHKKIHVYALPAVQEALDTMEQNGEWKTTVELSWSELQFIRRLLIADEVSTQMAGYNLGATLERKRGERNGK